MNSITLKKKLSHKLYNCQQLKKIIKNILKLNEKLRQYLTLRFEKGIQNGTASWFWPLGYVDYPSLGHFSKNKF